MIRSFTIGLLLLAVAGCAKQPEPGGITVIELDAGVPDEPAPAGRKFTRSEHPITNTITISTIVDDLPIEVRNVTEKEQRRLHVEWKPVRTIERDGETLFQFSGRLLLASAAGDAPQPVAWPQPVRVLLAREAGQKLDWSEYLREEQTATAETVVAWPWQPAEPAPGPGEFLAEFPTHAVRRLPGSTGRFQLGLSLGRRTGNELSWNDRAPPLPQSLTTIELAGPAKLSESVRLINACPSEIGWDHDPIVLVRAVNHLRTLGQKRAIFALRDYHRLVGVRHGPHKGRVPEDIATADPSCLQMLIPLAFGASNSFSAINWGNRGYYITLADGIPFHSIRFHGSSGGPRRVEWLIDWAEREGRLLDKPLRPTDRPLEAADALFDRIATPPDREDRFDQGLKGHLRRQALRMIHRLMLPGEPLTIDDVRDDADWARVKSRAAALDIRWDAERQEYVLPKK